MPETLSPREMLAKLVSFDTVSSKSNLPLISFVEEYLAGHGVASRIIRTGVIRTGVTRTGVVLRGIESSVAARCVR